MTVPSLPTAQPTLLDAMTMPYRPSVVPLVFVLHVAPPSVVLMTVPASPIAIPTVDEIMSTSRKVWVTPDTPAVHVILFVVYTTVPLSPTAMHVLALPQSMPFKLFVVGDVNSVQPAANAECAEKNVAKIIAPITAGEYFRIMQEYEIEFLSTLRYAFTTMPYCCLLSCCLGF